MKKTVYTLFFLVFISSLFAQQISVKSFRKLQNDMDARLSETALKDFNGEQSAIIKVVTTQTGFTFDCGSVGIVKTINKPSEIWVYVPHGAKRISIFHEKLGQVRDWMFTEPIEKATVYELVLTTGKLITTVEETIDSQWLVINPEPADASVYLNDLFVKSGTYQTKLKPGSYSYRVEAPLYHTEAGKVEITDSKKEISSKLKPAFGYVTVNTEPEKDAKVIIDGKTLTTNTPCKSEALASGIHTVQVIKEMYQPSTQKVTITDEQTTPVNFKLQPNFAELNITTSAEATLYVNNEQKAKGNWNGRLNPGVYTLEARLDKHRPAKQDIELAAGDVKTANLQPTPIYGSLDIISTPVGANITINGKDYGTTPITIGKLLIGNYAFRLTKDGFKTTIKDIKINDNQPLNLNEVLETGSDETSESLYNNAKLKFDQKDYNAAIVYCIKSVELNSKYAKSFNLMADAKYSLKDYKGALNDYSQAIRLNPKFANAYLGKAKTKCELNDTTGLMALFNKAIKLNPHYYEAYYRRAAEKWSRKRYKDAIIDLNTALENNPTYIDALMERVLINKDLKHYYKALVDLNKVIEINPNYLDAYYCISNIFRDNIKDINKSIEILNKGLVANPNNVDLLIGRGVSYEDDNKKDYLSAIADYSKVIEIDPNNYNAYTKRAYTRIELKQYQDAINDFLKSNELNPSDTTSHSKYLLKIAELEIELENYDAAITYYKKAGIEQCHNETAYSFEIGKCQFLKKEYTDAIITLNISIAKDYICENYFYRGCSKQELKDYYGAIKDFDYVIKKEPNNSDAYFNRALSKWNIDDLQGALIDYNKVIKIEPDNSIAYYNRGLLKLYMKNKEDACKDFSKAGELGYLKAYDEIKESCK